MLQLLLCPAPLHNLVRRPVAERRFMYTTSWTLTLTYCSNKNPEEADQAIG